jgi:YD repeat-containing protein
MIYDPVWNVLTSTTDPLGHSWSLSHESSGNPISVTDPLGHATALGHGFLGQPTSVADVPRTPFSSRTATVICRQ